MTRWTALCALGSLLACGGSSSGGGGSGTVTGTAAGISISSVVEAGSYVYNGVNCSNAGEQEAAVYVYLSSVGGVCSAYQTNKALPNGNGIAMTIFSHGSGAQTSIGPGTYSVSLTASPFVLAGIGPTACGDSGLAGSGSITLTAVSSSGVKGTFNLTFVDSMGNPAGTVTGSFDAPVCTVSNICNVSKTDGC